MANVVELERFLVPTERGTVTLQSAGVEVYESHVIPGLTADVARAGRYQVWLSSLAQDLVKISVIAYHVGPDATVDNEPGEVVLDKQPVEFYDASVTIVAHAMGLQGEFTLPGGAGQYRVIVTTDRSARERVSRHAMETLSEEGDLGRIRARLEEYDGQEWYRVYFQYVDPIVDDEDDLDD